MVTPGVVVVSWAEMAASPAQPLFLTPSSRFRHSNLLTLPLLLPSESSIATPFASSFEAPVMTKFWVTVAPPCGWTVAEAGDAAVQLRSASAAVAV
jgi:hypothetical protein